MKKLSILVLFSSVFFACSNSNRDSDKAMEDSGKKEAEERNDAKFSKDEEHDAQFVVDAANLNLEEIALGSIAMKSGTTKDVKDLGMAMNREHRTAYDQISEYARKKSISIPSNIGEPAMKDSNEFVNLKGSDFNEKYIDKMVNAHKDAISLYEKGADNCKDPELVAWINAQLPELRKHLDLSMDVQKKIVKK